MYRTLVKLSDGTEITSGPAETTYIRNSKIREAVNSGHELTLGSACATEVELIIVSTQGPPRITSGDELLVFKVPEAGEAVQIGVFTATQPTKTSNNAYKVIAYDRVLKLEKDLTSWLTLLDGWPYRLDVFAQLVCQECGVTLKTTEFTNADFLVNQFRVASITGRRIMEWVGQLAARFIRATATGDIELAWYTEVDVTVAPSGDLHYYMGSLQYEDYQVSPIEAVQVRLADSDAGLLWPEVNPNLNVYVLKGNRLISAITADTQPYIEAIGATLGSFTYTPCKLAIPASMHIRAGSIIRVETLNGQVFRTYVMSKTQAGQRDTLECTGSARRTDASAYEEDLRNLSDEAAEGALKRQTQLDVFNKLTGHGRAQGLFLDVDGQLFINASYLSTGVLSSKDGATFYLDLDNGILEMNATDLTISGRSVSEVSLEGMSQQDVVDKITNGGVAEGIYLHEGQLYLNASYLNTGALNAALMTTGILQSKDDGETFFLDLDNGVFHMSGTGKFMSADGKSYITVEGSEFVLYAKQGEYGQFADIARIGFTEDSEGDDYPYFLMGSADAAGADFDKIGLLKMFKNGLYIGNSAPRDSVGSFVGLVGASGLFVDTTEPRPYLVNGTQLADAFECVFA